ncbi:MAG: hypothetical protein KGD65_14835 [Candidatus Lokiarchaeota archaeon]|nr:hypothetical protein [Candidatus Lokiarchaeota archaeon]
MEVQIGKMILYGLLSALFYIVVPLVLFEVIGSLGYMTFTQAFKTSILIFGIIGVFISMLRHLFPTDTSANRLVAFGATLYSGIYLLYIFGGFTPGVSLGTYSISFGPISALLGLQLIAWLFLASSGIRALRYLVEAIELRKHKEYSVTVRKPFKLSKVFKVFGTIMGLGIACYFGSLVYSGLNLGFDIDDSFVHDHDDGGTPAIPADDSLSINMSFDQSNQGLFAIYDVSIDVRFIVDTSTNPGLLPVGTVVGSSLNNYFGTFHSFTVTPDNTVTVTIDPTWIVEFLTTDCTLEFRISLSTLYAGILVNLNVSINNVPWPHIV